MNSKREYHNDKMAERSRRAIGKSRVSPLRFLNTSDVIRYLICVYASHFFAGRPYHSIKHCAPRISSKMATIDECIEFALKNIGFDEGMESADITNENILLLDEYSKVKLF